MQRADVKGRLRHGVALHTPPGGRRVAPAPVLRVGAADQPRLDRRGLRGVPAGRLGDARVGRCIGSGAGRRTRRVQPQARDDVRGDFRAGRVAVRQEAVQGGANHRLHRPQEDRARHADPARGIVVRPVQVHEQGGRRRSVTACGAGCARGGGAGGAQDGRLDGGALDWAAAERRHVVRVVARPRRHHLPVPGGADRVRRRRVRGRDGRGRPVGRAARAAGRRVNRVRAPSVRLRQDAPHRLLLQFGRRAEGARQARCGDGAGARQAPHRLQRAAGLDGAAGGNRARVRRAVRHGGARDRRGRTQEEDGAALRPAGPGGGGGRGAASAGEGRGRGVRGAAAQDGGGARAHRQGGGHGNQGPADDGGPGGERGAEGAGAPRRVDGLGQRLQR